jgi:hypothetical protein
VSVNGHIRAKSVGTVQYSVFVCIYACAGYMKQQEQFEECTHVPVYIQGPIAFERERETFNAQNEGREVDKRSNDDRSCPPHFF